MKSLITPIIFIFFGTNLAEAQIEKPSIKLPNRPIIDRPIDLNLDLDKIKAEIRENKYCYTMQLAKEIIIPLPQPRMPKAVVGYYNGNSYAKIEREYLRTNGLLLRSDRNFNRAQGNNYEILIYPERTNSKKVDVNNVKLTWRSPERGLKTFNLQNVSVKYKIQGILITGDYEIDGITFGVSISLIKGSCLI